MDRTHLAVSTISIALKSSVLFNGIHSALELGARRVHVGDHGTDVTDDSGEDEHADQVIDDDENEFDFRFRWLSLPNGRQRQRGPVNVELRVLSFKLFYRVVTSKN